MSLIGSRWSNTLFGLLSGTGFQGQRLIEFTDAVGFGSVSHIVGKSFTTTDIGSITGLGIGTGTGIVGLISSFISDNIFNLCQSAFGQSGSRLRDITDALAQALITELNLATLTSQHTPVFLGSGTIDIGSIGVIGGPWGTSIESEGSGHGFQGIHWGNFASAIGEGQAQGVLNSGTGNLTIVGSFAGATPPGPLPGAGIGTGVIR
jgi:hypothetical protein